MHAYYILENLLYFRGMETNPKRFPSEVVSIHLLHKSYSLDNADVSARYSQSPLHVSLRGRKQSRFVPSQAFSENREANFEHKKRVSESETLSLLGGDEWARTTDSRIFSPMLYQLSYITALTRHKSKNNC